MIRYLASLNKFKDVLLPLLPVVVLGGLIVSLSQGQIPFADKLGITNKGQIAQSGQELKRLLETNNLVGETAPTSTMPAANAACFCDNLPAGTIRCSANNLSQEECRLSLNGQCQWQRTGSCQYGCSGGQCQPEVIDCCGPLENCGGINYGWGQKGCNLYQRACNWCGQTPPIIFTPTPTPALAWINTPVPTATPALATPTPTPLTTGPVLPTRTPTPDLPPTTPTLLPTGTPAAVFACLDVGIYANIADPLPIYNFSSVKIGDRVFLIAHANLAGSPSRARFKINGGTNKVGPWCVGANLVKTSEWCLTSRQSGNRFYVPLDIAGAGVFRMEAMVYYQADGAWH